MAEAPTLNNLANLTNETTAVATINGNSSAIATAFEDVLSLSGTAPNQMQSTLDMNNNRIINLPIPVSTSEPVTLSYMNNYLTTGQGVTGLTGVPVSSVMQTVVNESTLSAARTALGVSTPVNVLWYGAVGDGITDNTTAMQQAHNTGKLVYYPAGSYVFSSITINQGGIVGDGPALTHLYTNSATGDAITIGGTVYLGSGNSALLTSNYMKLNDFALSPSVTKTSGSGINFNPITAEIQYAYVNNIVIISCPTCLIFSAASNWTVSNSKFMQYNVAGMQVANSNVADSGDSVIVGSLFTTSQLTGSGIIQNSSGGLKVSASKFNGGEYGYNMQFNSTSTGDLMFVGNSIENTSVSAMNFQRASGSGTFSNMTICANEMAELGAHGITTDTSGFLIGMAITGNTISTQGPLGLYGILLGSGIGLTVTGNTLFGNGTGDIGIVTGSTCAAGKIGGNLTYNYATSTNIAGTNMSTSF